MKFTINSYSLNLCNHFKSKGNEQLRIANTTKYANLQKVSRQSSFHRQRMCSRQHSSREAMIAETIPLFRCENRGRVKWLRLLSARHLSIYYTCGMCILSSMRVITWFNIHTFTRSVYIGLCNFRTCDYIKPKS